VTVTTVAERRPVSFTASSRARISRSRVAGSERLAQTWRSALSPVNLRARKSTSL
jgi:hypothetical protein